MADKAIVVLGAGVIGLTTTLQLLRAGYKNVTIVAQQFPSDSCRDPTYASPWAGVIFVPESIENTTEQQLELASWTEFRTLAESQPSAGVWFQDKFSFYREETRPKDQAYDWWQNLVLGYHHLAPEDVPDFADWGIKYNTMALDPDTYLQYLLDQCVARGAQTERRDVGHIREAFIKKDENSTRSSSRADLVVNCAGLRVRELQGVQDTTVNPVLGQLVIVENRSHGMYFVPYDEKLGMNRDIGETSYIIERPPGHGTALGGTHWSMSVKGLDELQRTPDMNVSEGIMKRALQICPALDTLNEGIGGLRVIRHQIGYRAYRKDGLRIESEEIQDEELGPLKIIHNYGVGGTGYQLSYGCANQVVRLVENL